MSEHTPGPWTVYDQSLDDNVEYGCTIESKTDKDAGWVAMEIHNRKDAHLIAAAPELLKACEAAAELYDELGLGSLEAAAKYGPDYEPPTDIECLKMREDLEAAIAKAVNANPKR